MATSRKIILLFILLLIPAILFGAENYFFTNFSTGVITRKLDARIDYEKYFDGARQLENLIVYPQGGVFKRGGTKYVSGTSDSGTTKAILVPFEYSTSQAYILEFGEGYIRFFKDQGQIYSGTTSGTNAYSIATTYTANELSELKFTQSADYLYIAHSSYAPAKLTRSGHTAWTLSNIVFDSPATVEQSYYPSSAVTPGNDSGSGVTFIATSNTFLTGDIGRSLKSGSGEAIITDITGTSGVTADIVSSFSSTAQINSGSWYLEGTPAAQLDPVDSPIAENSIVVVSSGVSTFRSSDIGSYIYISGGLLKIISVTSSTSIKCQIIDVLDAHTASSSWSLEGDAWSATTGYPAAVQFFEERLCWGGTSTYPQTIWLSHSGDFENLGSGTGDDDGMAITFASSQVNAIRWMKEGEALRVGTTGSEWTLGALSTSDGITPSNIRLKQHTSNGSANIDAINVNRDVFHVQRGSRKLRIFGFDWQADGYVSSDVTLLSEHLFSGTSIIQIAYQKEPYGIIWALTADGNLHGLTWIKEQNVFAWHTHTTDGNIESIAVIPGTNSDELWMIVRRNIDGTYYRFVEYMVDPEMDDMNNAFYVDCGLTYTGSATTRISGLSYLSGETVAILANGGIQSDKMVDSLGGVTLDSSGSTVQIGLAYTAILETIDLPPGTGITRRIPEIDVRFYKTAYAKWGASTATLDAVYFEGSGTTPYTGDIELNYPGGWEQSQTILMTSDEPLPFSVSGILVKYE